MSVYFERNPYLRAVKRKVHLNDESKIFNHAKAGLQFKYVDVSVKKFNQEYLAEGWFGHKVIALPAAISSGIVKTIYHLAKALLVGIVCSRDSNYLKAHFFYIARDLQESFGWLTTLLNDRYGQYHTQESGFHKSCYDCFLTRNIQPDAPSTTPFQEPPQNHTHYRQNKFHPTYLASVRNRMMRDPSSFSNLNYDLKNEDVVAAVLSGCRSAEEAKKVIRNANYDAKSSKKVGLALVKIDPTLLRQLNYDIRGDEDVVTAALSGCRSVEQAKKVISNVSFTAKSSKKVGLALVKIDPTLLRQLNYEAQNDEDVVATALSGCRNTEQAKKVISSAHFTAKSSKKVGLALVKIDPTLLGQLYYGARNDLNVVLLAIELSTKHTIHQIWDYVEIDAASNQEVKAKVKEKYPNFFQHRAFPNHRYKTFQEFPSFNAPNTPNQTSHDTAQTKWSEPDDLKDKTSKAANIVRRILQQNHHLSVNLTGTETEVKVSNETAKSILCQFLDLDKKTLDEELKKAYKKAVLFIHPDKLDLKSGNEAFIVLTAAYNHAGFR